MQQSLRAVYARISELKDRICPYSAYIGGNTCGNLFVAFNGNSELSSDLHAECTANASFHQVEFHEISNQDSFIAVLTANPGSTVLLHTCHHQDVMSRLFDLVRNSIIRILFTLPAIIDLTAESSPELLHESSEDMQLSAIWKSSNNLDLSAPSSYPSVQSQRQFAYLWNSTSAEMIMARNRILYQLSSKTNQSPIVWDGIISRYISDNSNAKDCEVYDHIKQSLTNRLDINSTARALGRARTIFDLAQAAGGCAIASFLDYGCGDSSITVQLAALLGLNSDSAFGCDVRNPGQLVDLNNDSMNSKGVVSFSFVPITNNSILPNYHFPPISLLTSLQCIHHLTHHPSQLFAEWHKILDINGLVIIREHDVEMNDHASRIAIDVIHCLYYLVLTNPPEWPGVLNEYYANYYSQNALYLELTAAGFDRVGGGLLDDEYHVDDKVWTEADGSVMFKNAIRAYYSVFRRRRERDLIIN